ncbi:MAG: hypothetical protein ACLR2E_19300 [Lachnospiraceae bacterium]
MGRGSEPLGNGIAQVLQDFPVSIGKKPVCEAQVRILLPVDLVDVLPGSGSKLRCDLVAGIGTFRAAALCLQASVPVKGLPAEKCPQEIFVFFHNLAPFIKYFTVFIIAKGIGDVNQRKTLCRKCTGKGKNVHLSLQIFAVHEKLLII